MTWTGYRWRLAADSRWVRLPTGGDRQGGPGGDWQGGPGGDWQGGAAARLLGPGAPADVRADLAGQLGFWLTDCQARAVPAALALVPEDMATVAALAELRAYRMDEDDPAAGTIEWLASNLAVDQRPAVGQAAAEVIELPAGPAVRLRGIYTGTQDQEGSGVLVERVLHAVRPPQITDLLLLSTTWAVLALGDELAAWADALARSLSVEPAS